MINKFTLRKAGTAQLFLILILLISGGLCAQNIIITVAGNGNFGYAGDSGLAKSAQLAGPEGVFVDKQGNIFIADEANNVIRKVDAGTGIIHTIAGTGVPGYYGDGGLADTAQLYGPTSVFADDSGNIFIADFGNNVIREIVDSNGVIITVAGNGYGGYTSDGIPATAARLANPSSVFVDKQRNIYIADTYNSRIRRVDADSAYITTVAGDSIQGYSGDGGLADTASLYAPYGVVVDANGNIYISDGNSTVRMVTAGTGIISTIAGNANPGYSGNGGQATNAQLNEPAGICLDKNGNLYIADYTNNVVRMVNAQGIISTFAGNDTLGYWGDGGLADTGRLNGPRGVFMSDSGFLYIADFNNNRIREVGPGLSTSIYPISASLYYNIYPNPSNGRFSIKASDSNKPFVVELFNSLGQRMYQSAEVSLSTEINPGEIAEGLYLVRIICDGITGVQRIVVAR